MGPARLDFPASRGKPLAASRLQVHLRFPERAAGNNADSAMPAPDQETLFGPERADIALSVTNLALGRFAPGAPAPAISKLAIVTELHGHLPQPVSAQSLMAWRDAGGTLEVTSLDLNWGEVTLTAEGSLALDEDMRPLGALTLKAVNVLPLVRYLASLDLIDKDTAPVLAEGIATITALGDTGTAQNPLSLPLTIQGGQILLGPIPIATVGPVLQ